MKQVILEGEEMKSNGSLLLLFEEKGKAMIRRIYACPCGKAE